jgi:hypothetical protein
MTIPVFQISMLVGVAAYMMRCRAEVRRRNRQSWGALVARLSPGWQASVVNMGLPAEPAQLSAIYRDAKVMQEIADYAYRRYENLDPAQIESLHREATLLRFRALAALARYGITKPPKA